MRKIPVTKPYFTEAEKDAACSAIESGWVAQGPKVTEFEKAIASHEGVKEGVATTSCTTALHLAMLTEGLGPGMDAIAPAFTFVATVNSIVMTGATPIICDIIQDTFNINPQQVETIIEDNYSEKEGRLFNKKTGNVLWGIVPVHQFGLCCEIDRINHIAQTYSLKVIEDAACALGAKIGDKHQGAFGNTSCISFHPRKSITTGEGGMVLTDNSQLAKKMRELRTHGSTVSADIRDKSHGFLLPEYNEAGYNYRMTDIQAAIGLAQTEKLDFIIEEKRKRALFYNELISKNIPELKVPVEPNNYYHTYQSYVCMLDLDILNINGIEEGGLFRNRLLQRLEDLGISTRQGTHAVHMLGYYKNRFGFKSNDFAKAYACDHLSITLPLYIGITDEAQKYVIDTIRNTIDEMRIMK